MRPQRSSVLETFVAVVSSWPGVEVVSHHFGGVAFRMGRVELGHIHANGSLDLQFPRALRDRLIDEGWATYHHVLPVSDWVTFHLGAVADIHQALRLLRLAYLRRRLHTAANDDEVLHEVSQFDPSPDLMETLLTRRITSGTGKVWSR